MRYNAYLIASSKSLVNAAKEDLEKWIKKHHDSFLGLIDYSDLHRKKKATIRFSHETLQLEAFDAPDNDPVVLMPETLDPIAADKSK